MCVWGAADSVRSFSKATKAVDDVEGCHYETRGGLEGPVIAKYVIKGKKVNRGYGDDGGVAIS